MIILLIWLGVLVAALTIYCRQIYSQFEKYGVKHFKPLPLIGNMGGMMLRKHHFATGLANLYEAFPEEKFVGSYEFTSLVVVARDLELIKKITVKDFESFLDHRNKFEGSDSYLARSLIFLKGQEWKDMRSTLSPAFTSSKIRLMVPFMVEVGDQMIADLKEKLKSSNGYIEVDCKDLASRYANDVIASCAFGVKVDSFKDKHNEFYELGKETTGFGFNKLLRFILVAYFPKVAKLVGVELMSKASMDFFKNLVIGAIEDRNKRNIVRPDMIHLLNEAKNVSPIVIMPGFGHKMIYSLADPRNFVSATQEKQTKKEALVKKGGKLTHDAVSSDDISTGFASVEESSVGTKKVNREWSDSDIISQAVLFFMAGFDTVSTTMAFLLYELAANPEVQEKLAQEIKEVDIKNGGKFDLKIIQSMTYLDMVVSELIRMWPPGPALERLCNADYNLGKPNRDAKEDFIIHKGSSVIIPVLAIHRDPRYFPNPNKFDPERFSAENQHNIQPLTYLPFGLGPRNCIGSRFALCEVKVMTYQILRHMEISPCERTSFPAELDPSSFSVTLKGGHWLRFKARS